MRVILSATILALLLGAAGANAAPVADYQFQNTLADGSAPPLTTTGPTSFATETVKGEPRTVLRFQVGSGLQLSPTTGTISNTTYSVAALFRFDDVSGYRRVLDTSDGNSDNGLYVNDGLLDFYVGGDNSGSTPIANGQYVTVAVTRDGGSKQITGYVNGVQQFQLIDSADDGVIDSNNALRFFIDNTTENASGAVSRIQIFNTVLSPAQVAALDLAPPIPGTPTLSQSMLALLAVGLACAAAIRIGRA